jgi:hypothetical protein
MSKSQVGEEITFDGAQYVVTQISMRAKDGSKKVVLQEVVPQE